MLMMDQVLIKDRKYNGQYVVIKDFNDPETFKWFRAGAFIMVDEDQLL